MWIKNSKGEKSWSLTVALVAFCTVTSVLIYATLARVDVSDLSGIIGVYLPASLALYWGRRHTEKKQ